MMDGPGRFGDMLNQETLKPRNLSETLASPRLLLRTLLVHDRAGGALRRRLHLDSGDHRPN